MKYSILMLPVLFFQYCRSQPVESLKTNADDNSMLWEISGNGLKEPSYLFGTFHLMCKEDIHLSDNLKQAVSNAQLVYFEMNLDDMSNTLGAMFYINMKDGKKLKDLYNADEYARVSAFFHDSLKTSLALLERMKPNFLQAFIYPEMMPCKTMSGLEEEIMAVAKKQKKDIRGFETIQFQASVFDSIPYKDQAKDLLDIIDSLPVYSKYFDTMLTVYKTQRLSDLEKMFADPRYNTDEKNQDILLDNRNRNWINQLKIILPEHNIFVAVGAGHLVGDKGLIALLRKEGYRLRAIVNK